LKLKISADKPINLKGIMIRAAADNPRILEQISKTISRMREQRKNIYDLMSNLLYISSVDIGSLKSKPKDLNKKFKPLKRRLNLNLNNIKRLTSGSGLMGLVIYECLRDLLPDKYYFYIEPEIYLEEYIIPLDYAIVNEHEEKCLVLAELKRFYSPLNIEHELRNALKKSLKLYKAHGDTTIVLHINISNKNLANNKEFMNAIYALRCIEETLPKLKVLITESTTGFHKFREEIHNGFKEIFKSA